jgi:putative ABC transport system permease protein
MLYNYLKIAFRNLLKQKFYTSINIAGLTLGITCCLLIFLFVQNELSYDHFHQKGNRIFRLLRVVQVNDELPQVPVSSGPFARALVTDFPDDIEATVRILAKSALISYGTKSFREDQLYLADSNFFQVFSFPLLKGNAKTALLEPNTLVISEEIAKKYFGSADPMGKLLAIDKDQTLKVTGVMANVPGNSHLKFNLVTSIQPLERQEWFNVWTTNSVYTYVLMRHPEQAKMLEEKLPHFVQKYLGKDLAQFGIQLNLNLQPLFDIYLNNTTAFDYVTHGNRHNIYIFSVISIFVLVIACINFMNLASARSAGRAKEVGMRKVLGAYKRSLVFQFLSESTLLAFIAVLLSVGLIRVVLPYFNAFTERNLTIPFAHPELYIFLLGVVLLVGIIAGSYPAFFLSSFKPVTVLKGHLSSGSGNPLLRKTLVVFQFAVSIFLIIGTVIIFRQMHYVQHKNLGFTKEQVITIPINNSDLFSKRNTFISRVEQLPGVKAGSVMSGEPSGFHELNMFSLAEKADEKFPLITVSTDFNYLPTFEISLIAGRNFSNSFPTDSTSAIILNETAVKQLGWAPLDAIGKEFSDNNNPSQKRKVIGVVKDYHFSSLKEAIAPLALIIRSDHRVAAIRLAAGNPEPTLAAIQQIYSEVAPQYPFEYTFLDDSFALLYKTEKKQAQLITVFSGLAIFIACLGLLGLASYTTEQRRKEIGIRKILGASVSGIVSLLSVDFLKLVVLANILAWPLAWYAMHRWLQNFTYRVDMGWAIFIVAGIAALLIAIFTISFQAIKVAVANPVNALRDE